MLLLKKNGNIAIKAMIVNHTFIGSFMCLTYTVLKKSDKICTNLVNTDNLLKSKIAIFFHILEHSFSSSIFYRPHSIETKPQEQALYVFEEYLQSFPT